ncbi:MAG: hypothetical protein GX767_01685 [Firmicutes bacterium]|nr:hypothetical protein [Bacillota bacterium]
MPAVVGIFNEHSQAERALRQLQENGFSEEQISLVAKRDENQEGGQEGQDLGDGTLTGSAIGGLAGLLAGTGALLIPGVGPIIAAGPLAATLTGVVGGGIAGGLIDYGISEERGRYYEERVRQGSVLVSVKAEDDKVENAAEILRNMGAEDVETH